MELPVSEPSPAAPKLAATAAAVPLTQRVVGRLSAPATRAMTNSRENVLGDLIADGQLAATQDAARGGAQLALMNPGGIRTDLVPAANGEITYGQLFAAQPFGNVLVVKTLTGAQILAPLEFFGDGMLIVRHHHERLDGSGYPDGLCGDAIPLGARIVAVADVYDALTSDRPYRPRLPHRLAMERLHREAGLTLDGELVKLFADTYPDGPPDRAV